MFKQPTPPTQPRSARSTAEGKAAPASFPTDVPYNYDLGVPRSAPMQGAYRENVQAGEGPMQGAVSFTHQPGEPQPFRNLRGGR